MPKESEIRKKAVAKLTNERWLYWYPPKVRYLQTDIFGIFDIICCKKAVGDLKFIQLTTVSNLSTRRKKIQKFLTENRISSKITRKAGIEIWAWSKRKKSFKIELI